MTLAYDHLIGQAFLYGVRDCYAIVRDLYRDNFGIELTNYARPNDWRSEAADLIRDLHDHDGFQMITDWKVKDLRPGDVLCMAIGESKPNHLAIYAGDNLIVHHLFGRFSTEAPYRDFFRTSTCFLARHPDVPDLRPSLPNTNVGDLLRGRYRVQADS